MKDITKKQVRIIGEGTAQGFQDALNGAINELCQKGIKYDIQFPQGSLFIAYVVYEETVKIAENARDEFNLKGICHRCSECPVWDEIRPYDGRIKHVRCEQCQRLTNKDMEACNWFYEQLKGGE